MSLDPLRPARVLVADDEPLLCQAMVAAIKLHWPAAVVVAACGDGDSAWRHLVEAAANPATAIDVAFLDIRMPGSSGLDVAQMIAEDWPSEAAPPHVVFVTAYDVYATAAFDAAALDYLVKPVETARLLRCFERVQHALRDRRQHAAALAPGWNEGQLHALAMAVAGVLPSLGSITPAGGMPGTNPSQPANTTSLRHLRVGQGDTVRLLPIAKLAYLQAADKYVRVVLAGNEPEGLVRESLKSLLQQLPSDLFVQIHRATVVNLDHVERVQREESGLWLILRGTGERLRVSRVYADQFKSM